MSGFPEKVKNIIIGSIVGMASILPGLSGAVIAAIFGVYERVIEDLGELRRKLKEDFWFIAMIGSGLVIGAVFFSILYQRIPSDLEFIAYAVFIGMIVGQLPDIFSIAVSEKKHIKMPHIAWFLVGLAVMAVIVIVQVFYGLERVESDGTVKAFTLIIVAGLIFSAGGLLPGLSAPTLLLALGIQNLMTASLAEFDPIMILLFGIGVLIGIIGFSKLIDRVLKKHHSITYFTVLGLTFGSIFTIIPSTDGWTDIIICVIAGVIGFLISMVFSYFGRKQRTDISL